MTPFLFALHLKLFIINCVNCVFKNPLPQWSIILKHAKNHYSNTKIGADKFYRKIIIVVKSITHKFWTFKNDFA